jgi:hypothetical protein
VLQLQAPCRAECRGLLVLPQLLVVLLCSQVPHLQVRYRLLPSRAAHSFTPGDGRQLGGVGRPRRPPLRLQQLQVPAALQDRAQVRQRQARPAAVRKVAQGGQAGGELRHVSRAAPGTPR